MGTELAALTEFLQAEGPDWQRQRKLTATPFNEQKSSLIWADSMRQANDMLQSWLCYDFNGLKCAADDTRALALHVEWIPGQCTLRLKACFSYFI
jgi:cytochrome P450